MINCDSFVTIGKQHKVCEDYILSNNSPTPYMILSDGCSSSKNTEMGARLLCHLAIKYLNYNSNNLHDIEYDEMGSWIIHNVEVAARLLGLQHSSLDATLIIAFLIDNFIKVYIYGDGAVISEDNKGRIIVNSVSFSKNAPFYLSYQIDKEKLQLYKQTDTSKICVTETEEGKTTTIYEYYEKTMFMMDTKVDRKILICSDGIQSFIKGKSMDQVGLLDIAKRFLSFKNTKGEFLKRRMNKELKVLEKEGITHFDDLSIGAFINIQGV